MINIEIARVMGIDHLWLNPPNQVLHKLYDLQKGHGIETIVGQSMQMNILHSNTRCGRMRLSVQRG
jgi:hypothetical protein